MDEAEALARQGMRRSEISSETRRPFELSDDLSARAAELGLTDNLDELRERGYSVLPEIAAPEFTTRLREACIRLAQETEGAARGYSAALLLGRDPIFGDVVLNPKIQLLVEVMCGQGALLSRLITSIRPKGSPSLPLHADQNRIPAPFPTHNQLFTLCWTMEEFTREGGCTQVIPGSHLARRHPTSEEIGREVGAIPVECAASSLACWDGSIWHGNYPRTLDGERVVLHLTFSRLALRTVERYDHLDEAWLEGKPAAPRIMLGREDFLGSTTIARGSADYSLSPRTFTWAKT